MKIDKLSILNGIEDIVEKNAIVYGVNARDFCKAVDEIRCLGAKKIYAADSNTVLWGNVVQGISVLSWNELQQMDAEEDIVIVIASQDYVKEICEALDKLRLRTQYVYTQYCLKLALFHNRNRLPVSEGERKKLDTFWDFEREHCEQDFLSSIISSGCYALENQLFGNAVHVFNAGKVGSKTVVKSCFEQKVIASHAHTIIPYDLNEQKKEEIRKIYASQENVKIISLIREPISRDISFFFENIWIDSYCGREESVDEAFRIWMKECLYKVTEDSGKFPLWYMDMNKPLFQWFDDEIKNVFNIDIFNYPFDKEKGYSIIKKDGVELLLIKLEKLNGLSEVIGGFLGKDSFEIYTENDSANKPYVYLYKQFQDKINIPGDYFAYYYGENSRLSHFYSDSEMEVYRKKWSKKINDGIQFFR